MKVRLHAKQKPLQPFRDFIQCPFPVFQFFLTAAASAALLAAAATAAPSDRYVEKLPPKPFGYEYAVADDYTGANFRKSETQDDYGVVKGSYTVALPDGRRQIVNYHADHEGGFIADVKYEGEPRYPDAPKGGYGKAPVFV